MSEFSSDATCKQWMSVLAKSQQGIWACVLCMLSLLWFCTKAEAQQSPFVGQWNWNRAQSVLPPGETPPSNMILDISQANPLHVRWSITVTSPQGSQAVESFDTPANGEFYPISSGTTASFRLPGNDAIVATFQGPSGQTDALHCTLAPDHNRMTCNGTVSGQDGNSARYVDVYDRK